MPELPEVETIRRSLLPLLEGACLRGVTELHAAVFENQTGGAAEGCVRGLRRRGKYLLIDLERAGEPVLLVVHLRMTGKLLVEEEGAVLRPHTHVLLHFEKEGHTFSLHYVDVRRFGRLQLIDGHNENSLPGLARLGPEPFAESFTVAYLQAACRRHGRAPLKAILLNQGVVAGLGNIYADEALYRARLHPARLGATIGPVRARRLRDAIRATLADGIGHGGTSFRDYVDALGQAGSFVQELQVYGRRGQACRRCNEPLQIGKLAGRTTHFCPLCQK